MASVIGSQQAARRQACVIARVSSSLPQTTERPARRSKPKENSLAIHQAGQQGAGAFATRPIANGDTVLHFSGPLASVDAISDFTHYLEIGPGAFIGPSGWDDDYVNHSCEPNCAVITVNGVPTLKAICDISVGEQLTFDYSTTMIKDKTSFNCCCQSNSCRGLIGDFFSLPRAMRRHFVEQGLVPQFIRRAYFNSLRRTVSARAA